MDLTVLLWLACCFFPATISPDGSTLKPTLLTIACSMESPTILPLTLARPWQLAQMHHVSIDALVIFASWEAEYGGAVADESDLSWAEPGAAAAAVADFGVESSTVKFTTPCTLNSSAVSVPVLSKQQIVTKPAYGILHCSETKILMRCSEAIDVVMFRESCIGSSGGITFVTMTMQCKNSFQRLP